MDIVVYALCKKYTNRFLTSGSVFKGTLENVTNIPTTANVGDWYICNFTDDGLGIAAGDRIIYNSTTTYAIDKFETKGETGVGIANVELRVIQNGDIEETHIIFTMDDKDATEIDAGVIPVGQSASLSYSETVAVEDTVWTINHDLDAEWYELTITCLDGDFNRVIGDIDTDNCTTDTLVINFREPVSGKIIVKK